jgi:16S rRNA (guanine966-N2)-methyltransferase
MKDRVREALFSHLGADVEAKHAVDLFAGTGALGLEALSRGAARATFVEQHAQTAELIRRNVAALGLAATAVVVQADAFYWARQTPPGGDTPWLVFISPPYDFYVDRAADMIELIEFLVAQAPRTSRIVVEAYARFDFGHLPRPEDWHLREYAPAILGILRIP